jgi:hypothetical protein
MKQYVIDQLRENDFLQLEDYFNNNSEAAELPGIYWIPLPKSLLEQSQLDHPACQPFYFAVNLERNSISFELLIRTRSRLRCGCIQYATQTQRDYILNYANQLFEKLNLKT